MRAQNLWLTTLLSAIALSSLVQCGKTVSKAANVVITQVPDKPIIITADVGVYTAPWFDFTIRIKNGSTQKFTIVAITVDVTITDANGQQATKTYAADAGIFDISTDSLVCTYSTFGTWAVNEEKYVSIGNGGTGCPNREVGFRVDGLPKPFNTNSYRYSVKVKPLGYFIDDNDLPADRFEKFKYFYTQ